MSEEYVKLSDVKDEFYAAMADGETATYQDICEHLDALEAILLEPETKATVISEQSVQLSEKDSRIATLTQELAEADELAMSLYEAQEQQTTTESGEEDA